MFGSQSAGKCRPFSPGALCEGIPVLVVSRRRPCWSDTPIENRKSMKRLTVAAAALAAATLTIVAQSRAEADHDYARTVSTTTAKTGNPKKAGYEAKSAAAKDTQEAKGKARG